MGKQGFLVLAGLLLASAAPARFEERVLATHNAARAEVGSAPLVWDAKLAQSAASGAAHLARTGTLEHAPPDKGTADQGENLWQGSKGDYAPEEMVEVWVKEKAAFKPGFFPAVTKTGSVDDVGHYTQLVWHSTTHVGCSVATGAEDDVLVCRYSPPGNVIGQSPLVPKKVPKPVSKKRRRGG
jgi:uncharacterized protein YkwD